MRGLLFGVILGSLLGAGATVILAGPIQRDYREPLPGLPMIATESSLMFSWVKKIDPAVMRDLRNMIRKECVGLR